MKKDILGILPTLSKKDLREVKAALDFLLEGEVEPKDRGEFEIQAFEALRAVLSTLGIKLQRNYLDKPGPYLKHWDASIRGLEGVLVRFRTDPATPLATPVLYATLRLLWGLLAADLKERKVPVTAGSMVSNMHRLGEVFDGPLGFPGYLNTGLAPLVIKRILEVSK